MRTHHENPPRQQNDAFWRHILPDTPAPYQQAFLLDLIGEHVAAATESGKAQHIDGGTRTVTVADVDWDRFLPALAAARPAHVFDGIRAPATPAVATEPATRPGKDFAALPEDERVPACRVSSGRKRRQSSNTPRPRTSTPRGGPRPWLRLAGLGPAAQAPRRREGPVTGDVGRFEYATAAELAQHLGALIAAAPALRDEGDGFSAGLRLAVSVVALPGAKLVVRKCCAGFEWEERG